MLRKFLAPLYLVLLVSACSQPALPAPTPVATQMTPEVKPTPVAPIPTVVTPTHVAPTATSLPTATTAPLTGTPAPATTPLNFACSTAYADGGNLYCLGEGGTPALIVKGEGLLINPKVSPDGAVIAYMTTPTNGTNPLWVAKADGSGSRLLVGPDQVPAGDPNRINSPLAFEWRPGTHTLFFNTRFILLSGPGGPGERINADLWSVDADSGSVKLILPRQSTGRFSLSPDGKFVALSLPQAIDIVESDGSNHRHLLDFPFVNTHSEYSFSPPVTWSPDSSFFSVAIPSADPLAADAHVTFYRMGVDGSVQKLGTYPGNFVFGGPSFPEFSPDGKYVVYARTEQSIQVTVLHLFNADGSGDKVLAQEKFLNGRGWSPDSQHYAYAVMPVGGGFVVTLGGDIQPFAPGGLVADVKWLDANSFIFIGQADGKWGLYFQRLGEKMQVLVSGLGEGVSFDVRQGINAP